MIDVLLADDQELVRTGFRMILESEPGIKVVGETTTGREALTLSARLRPTVVLWISAGPNLTACRPPASWPPGIPPRES
jgi:DNA-binding NarL/FixJ family response regulator